MMPARTLVRSALLALLAAAVLLGAGSLLQGPQADALTITTIVNQTACNTGYVRTTPDLCLFADAEHPQLLFSAAPAATDTTLSSGIAQATALILKVKCHAIAGTASPADIRVAIRPSVAADQAQTENNTMCHTRTAPTVGAQSYDVAVAAVPATAGDVEYEALQSTGGSQAYDLRINVVGYYD